jgi:hypothetical protein
VLVVLLEAVVPEELVFRCEVVSVVEAVFDTDEAVVESVVERFDERAVFGSL